jgi:hypothetical protein
MIIWGSRPITSTISSGMFACPECKRNAAYEKKRARRFFTLYFIPLFPTDNLGEWIECGRCRSKFKEGVLQNRLPQSDIDRMQALVNAVAFAGGLAARLEGAADHQALAKFADALQKFGGTPMTPDQILTSAANAKPEPAEVRGVLEPAAQGLTGPAKEALFGMIYRVLVPRGSPSGFASEFLQAAGEGLGISPAHLKGLIVTLQEGNA